MSGQETGEDSDCYCHDGINKERSVKVNLKVRLRAKNNDNREKKYYHVFKNHFEREITKENFVQNKIETLFYSIFRDKMR